MPRLKKTRNQHPMELRSPSPPAWGGTHSYSLETSSNKRQKWNLFGGKSQRGRGLGVRGVPTGPRTPMRPPRGRGYHPPPPARDSQRQETYHPVPRTATNPFGFDNMPPTPADPRPLPDDHPLMMEMVELKAVREKRRLYWAGLSEQIGEEWDNPASYDRQRWKTEEGLADKKFQELAGQIALAERGIVEPDRPPDRENSQATHSSGAHVQDSSIPRVSNRFGRRAGRITKSRPLGMQTEFNSISDSTSSRQESNRYGSPQGAVRYADKRQTDAVSKWMDNIGMGFDPAEPKPPPSPIYVGSSDDSIHVDSDNEIWFGDAEALALSEDRFDSSHGRGESGCKEKGVCDDMCRGDQSLWSVDDEAIFEEAEAQREAQRMEMARISALENEKPMELELPVSRDPRLFRTQQTVNTQIVEVVNDNTTSIEDISAKYPRIISGNAFKQTKQHPVPEVDADKSTWIEADRNSGGYSSIKSRTMNKDNLPQPNAVVNNSKEPEAPAPAKDIFDAILENLDKSSPSRSTSPKKPATNTSSGAAFAPASTTSLSKSELTSRFFDKKTNFAQALAAAALRGLQARRKQNATMIENVKPTTPVPASEPGESMDAVMKSSDGVQDQIPGLESSKVAIEDEREILGLSARDRTTTPVATQEVSKVLEVNEEILDVQSSDNVQASATVQEPLKKIELEEEILDFPSKIEKILSKPRPKAVDWMDIDHSSSIEILDLQDAPDASSEVKAKAEAETEGSGSDVAEFSSPRSLPDSIEEEGEEEVDDLEETSSEASSDITTTPYLPRRLPSPPRRVQLSRRWPKDIWISTGERIPFPPPPVHNRVLHIGNLAFSTTFRDLERFMRSWQVDEIILPQPPGLTHHVGYAFAIMASEAELETVLEDSFWYAIDERPVSFKRGKLPEAERIRWEAEMARWIEKKTLRRQLRMAEKEFVLSEARRIEREEQTEAARRFEEVANRDPNWIVPDDVVDDEGESERETEIPREKAGMEIVFDETVVVAVEAKLNDLDMSMRGLSDEEKELHLRYLEQELFAIIRQDRAGKMSPRLVERGRRLKAYLDELADGQVIEEYDE